MALTELLDTVRKQIDYLESFYLLNPQKKYLPVGHGGRFPLKSLGTIYHSLFTLSTPHMRFHDGLRAMGFAPGIGILKTYSTDNPKYNNSIKIYDAILNARDIFNVRGLPNYGYAPGGSALYLYDLNSFAEREWDYSEFSLDITNDYPKSMVRNTEYLAKITLERWSEQLIRTNALTTGGIVAGEPKSLYELVRE
jgi:hypothetical protein